MLRAQLGGPLDTIQMCQDIVEGNFNAHDVGVIDHIELQARIYTDFEILARNQPTLPTPAELAIAYGECTGLLTSEQITLLGDMLTDCDPGDENDYREPSSADR